jgi:hypothetical protein
LELERENLISENEKKFELSRHFHSDSEKSDSEGIMLVK